jgi:type IV pilus assembly protein PilM
MAKGAAVWGIDIGRCALKALRCRLDGNSVVADGFDYIEYPKLLTQPEADAPQLIKEALEQFLTRNSVKGDGVAIAVSGESGLARYFKPPPVDVKKIADIVKYEARQQIPFALEDVIWDYQRMAGGQEVDGFALDTEIGLFAMKREQVTKALAPFNTAGIEVDVIQLAPIAIYNYVAFDVAKELPEGEEYSSDNPPPSMIVLSIGTDTTDLVVTNGYRVWQRNIPLGGNHFTKQLSKELKLTFAKAEHLKRNPKQAEDPKAIFQAMRPVFADMVTEVQRSVGFFQSLDRKAKISGAVMLGNTVKLPGLVQYLGKHLGYQVQEVDSFNKLTGASVVAAPSFKDNVLAFSTCYGLCLQGLGKGKLSTNLLPREILTQRLIRAKKPWALAGVSALVLACALNYGFYVHTWKQVAAETEVEGTTWKQAIATATETTTYSQTQVTDDTAKMAHLDLIKKVGQEVVGSADRRLLWLELMKGLNKSLPEMAPGVTANVPTPDFKKLAFTQRRDLKIEYVETQFFQDLSMWWNDQVKGLYVEQNPDVAKKYGPGAAPADGSAPVDPAAAPVDPAAVAVVDPSMMAAPMSADGGTAGYTAGYGGEGGFGAELTPTVDLSTINIPPPAGPGWVVELKGHHFFNDPSDRRNTGSLHLHNTILRELKNGFVDLPLGPGQRTERFSMKELGIDYPILAIFNRPVKTQLPNPGYVPPAVPGTTTPGTPGGFGTATAAPATPLGVGGVPPMPGDPNFKNDPENPVWFDVYRCDFLIQFVWKETPLNLRLQEREKKRQEAEAAAKAAAEAGGAGAAGVAPAPGDATAPPPAPAVGPGAPPPTEGGQPAAGGVAPVPGPPGAPGVALPGAAAPGQPMAFPPAGPPAGGFAGPGTGAVAPGGALPGGAAPPQVPGAGQPQRPPGPGAIPAPPPDDLPPVQPAAPVQPGAAQPGVAPAGAQPGAIQPAATPPAAGANP